MNLKKRLMKRRLTKINIKLTGMVLKATDDLEKDPEYLELMDERKLLMIKLYGDDETWQNVF